MRALSASTLLLIAAAWLPGCGAARAPLPTAAPQSVEIGEYRIEPGDELEIRFPLSPEMNRVTLVRPDGRLSLPFVGEVYAEGLTPAELAQRLREAYSTELRDPEVAVMVRTMAARVYVDGQIQRPGGYPWSRQITATQAVARAGGLRDTAEDEYLLVLRRRPDGAQEVHRIQLGGEGAQPGQNADLYLAPYDLVLVPSSDVADVNKWVDQYIRKNIPITPSDVFFFGF
jgi:protein involved in polysaccharide export with SLBB domain